MAKHIEVKEKKNSKQKKETIIVLNCVIFFFFAKKKEFIRWSYLTRVAVFVCLIFVFYFRSREFFQPKSNSINTDTHMHGKNTHIYKHPIARKK